ncbi:hypothetical protein JCM33374_g109 [Metschnikowia sp. JCM 33374]|nr:hypothetical protein JCM33374_g109 [Metschnikowia sp. JCM 33374]
MKLSSSILLLVSSLAITGTASSVIETRRSDLKPGSALPLKVDKITDADNVPSHLTQGVSDGSEDESHNLQSLYMAISMIIVSEIGDKTFLIAALMSMKHSKYVVFSAAFSSLALMTVLSGIVGHALPTLISERITKLLAAVLFVVFGFKLFREGSAMSKDAGVGEEMAEVEEELQTSNMNAQMTNLEEGVTESRSASKSSQTLAQLTNLASFILSPVWIQVFVMTFLGEWGDRSQIATIAMAAGSDYWFVIFGAIIGHGLCTAAATIGGQLLATRISMRNVTLGGSFAFIVFAILYFYDFLTVDDAEIV